MIILDYIGLLLRLNSVCAIMVSYLCAGILINKSAFSPVLDILEEKKIVYHEITQIQISE